MWFNGGEGIPFPIEANNKREMGTQVSGEVVSK